MQIHLKRTEYRDDCTLGVLNVNGLLFQTVERPWLNNANGISCIPKGTYNFIPHGWDAATKFKKKRVWEITNVPNRTGILLHVANVSSQLEGCVGVGMKRGVVNGKPAVLESAIAINTLRAIIGENRGIISIE